MHLKVAGHAEHSAAAPKPVEVLKVPSKQGCGEYTEIVRGLGAKV